MGDVISVAGSAAMAAAWYWYSGMADTAPDKRTCIAMLVVPVLFIALRKPIDALLRPLEPFRSKIPPMVLAGCGVAIPFLVANYLYSRGESQFPFMFKTYMYSTLLSFIVLRTAVAGASPGGDVMLNRIQRLAWRAQRSKSLSLAALLQLLAINAFLLFCAPALFADDCTRDWRRAEDCLRTPGFAQGIGTTAGVLATVLVNGVAVVRLVLTPPQPVPTGGQDGGQDGGQPQQPPKEYFLNIQTQGYRTQMKTDGTDSLWVYASVSCNDPTVDCALLTQAVGFYLAGDNSSWITASPPAASGGSMAIELKAAPPTPDARLTPAGLDQRHGQRRARRQNRIGQCRDLAVFGGGVRRLGRRQKGSRGRLQQDG